MQRRLGADGHRRRRGEYRAAEAAKSAISSPLLEESIEGATGILLNITGGKDLGLFEVNEAAEIIHSAADARRQHHLRGGDRREHGRRDPRHPDRHRLRQGLDGAVRGLRPGAGARRARRVDRGPRIDDRQRSSLEIGDDEIDIPPFLR